jgi:fumarate reductase subunit D
MDDNQNSGGSNTSTNSETTVTATTTQSSTTEPKGTSSTFTFNEQTIMAGLSYVGPLVLVPFLTKKEDPFIQFHVKQGMLVFGIYLVIWLLGGWLFFLYPILNLVALVLSIIGIINVLKQTQKELPFIGKYASYIKI